LEEELQAPTWRGPAARAPSQPPSARRREREREREREGPRLRKELAAPAAELGCRKGQISEEGAGGGSSEEEELLDPAGAAASAEKQ